MGIMMWSTRGVVSDVVSGSHHAEHGTSALYGYGVGKALGRAVDKTDVGSSRWAPGRFRYMARANFTH